MYRKYYKYILIIILTSSFPFLGLLNNYFLSDDFGIVYSLGNTESLIDIFEMYYSNYRPIAALPTYLVYTIWGNNVTPYHFTGLFFHILSAILVYLLLLKISGKQFFSLLGGILFTVHWTHVETIAWYCVFQESMYVSFMVLSMLLFLRYLDNNRLILYILSLSFFIFGFFTQEKAILLIPLITTYDFIFNYRRKNKSLKKIILRIIPFYVTGLICFFIRYWMIGGTGITNKAGGYSINLFNIPFINNFIRSMEYLIVPLNIFDTHVYFKAISFIQNYTNIYLLPILFLIVLFFLVRFLKRRYGRADKIILFGVLWIAASVCYFSFFSIAPRYLFIVTVGYSILISGILMRLFESRFVQKVLIRYGALSIIAIYIVLQLVSNFKMQYVYEKASQFSEQIVSELHEVTEDIPEDHMVFFINLPATLGSQSYRFPPVNVLRFGYEHALKFMYGHSPIIVRNGIDFGDLYKIKSINDIMKFEKFIENNTYYLNKIPVRSKRHFVTFTDGHVKYVDNIHAFDWNKTGWKYKITNEGTITKY